MAKENRVLRRQSTAHLAVAAGFTNERDALHRQLHAASLKAARARDDFNALKRGVEERETALRIKLNAARAGAAAASDALPKLQQDLADRDRELAAVARVYGLLMPRPKYGDPSAWG